MARTGAVVRAVVVVGLLALPSGCGWDPLSDPPPPPEVQPLEVVVDSRVQPDRPCLLNVEQVRAGLHDVSVIGESGFTEVKIVDEDGEVVFRTDNEGQRIETDEDGDVTIIGGEDTSGPPARLRPGTHTVRCVPRDGVGGETSLEVLPARKGWRSEMP